jgi:hypothetical protein
MILFKNGRCIICVSLDNSRKIYSPLPFWLFCRPNTFNAYLVFCPPNLESATEYFQIESLYAINVVCYGSILVKFTHLFFYYNHFLNIVWLRFTCNNVRSFRPSIKLFDLTENSNFIIAMKLICKLKDFNGTKQTA